MASTIKIKRSSVAGKSPTTSDISAGELALNIKDQKLYSSNGSSVFEIGGGGGGSAANGFSGILVGANVVVADSSTDRLTITAGTRINIAANPTTDTITFSASTNDYLQVANAVSTYATIVSPTFTGNATFDTSTLFVDGTNNKVGIGTTSPSSKLYVNASGTENLVGFEHSNNTFAYVGLYTPDHTSYWGTGTALGVGGSADVAFGTTSSANLILLTTNTERMRIDSSGNVGIGTTTPGYKLEVNGSLNTTSFYIGGTQVTSTAAELNALDGITATVTELNYTDGVTSNIQTQLDAKLASSSYTAADVLSKLLTVDGTGSGLDADTLDGVQGSAFLRTDGSTVATGIVRFGGNLSIGSDNDVYLYESSAGAFSVRSGSSGSYKYLTFGADGALTIGGATVWHAGNDGPGSGLNADTLDGVQGSSFLRSDASATNTVDLRSPIFYDSDNTAYYINPYATNVRAFSAQVNDTVGDQSLYGIYLDYNGSGSDTLTADRNHWGMHIDMDITATGGDVNNEYRAYGQYVDLYNTGDPDLIYGQYSVAKTAHTSGTVTNLTAAYNYAQLLDTGTVSSMFGARNVAHVTFTGAQTLTVGYGAHNYFIHGPSLTGTTSSAYGSYNEIEISSGTINNAYGVRSIIDYNGGTIGNGYLYYGDWQGSSGTRWGIYLTGEEKNYFSGNVGIGTSSPSQLLHVSGIGYASTDFRAPIFYDSDNTSYYVNPAGPTVLSSLYLYGTVHMRGAESTQTLTDGATIAWGTDSGRIAYVTIAGNRTIAAPTNAEAGSYILHVIQDGTGNRTLTWNAVFKWPGGVAPVLSTAAGARDIFSFTHDGTYFYGSYINDVK